jgi:hypothetical protein
LVEATESLTALQHGTRTLTIYLGSVGYSLGASSSLVLPPFFSAGTPWFTNASAATQRFTGNIVRVGLNYKFGNYYAPAVYK